MNDKINLPADASLQEAKNLLRDKWDDGVECPCCTQYVKLYRRKITSSMAYGLILVYRYFEDHPDMEWLHMTNYLNLLDIPFPVKSGDKAMLRFWGLIEGKPEMREDKSNRAGYWKITDLGREFVRGVATVKSHAKIFNSKCYGLTGEQITIYQALTEKFIYSELMQNGRQ